MANFLKSAPHLLKPATLTGQDSEAQLKHVPDVNTSVHEAPTDGSTNQTMENAAVANGPAGAGKLSPRLVSTPQSRMTWQDTY